CILRIALACSKLWLHAPVLTLYTFCPARASESSRQFIQESVSILNRHCALPPFCLSLNQDLKLCLLGAGKSRTSVQPFNGPGPFVIVAFLVHGFRAVRAIFALIL